MPQETPSERRAFRWCVLAAGLMLGAFLAWVDQDGDGSGLGAIVGHAGVSLLVAGKFIIFAGLKEDAPSPWQLAAMVFLLDITFALLLSGGLRALEQAPLLGHGLRRARERALTLLAQYPGLERRAFFGVALFVFLPLAGTGAITGSFLARVFGLSRSLGLAAIALGSASTALAFALLAQFVGNQAETFLRNPALTGVSTVVLLFVAWRVYLGLLGRMKE